VSIELVLRRIRIAALGLITAAVATAHGSTASAEALLLVEVSTGKVLHAENATYPWYPASLTKLMTTYVALSAVREGRLSLSSLIAISERAHAQQPSKMGFGPGVQLTLDNAIKILMVKSANDIAVAIAEGVSGSVGNFAGEMNAAAERLGMTQSSFVNPNGLPDPTCPLATCPLPLYCFLNLTNSLKSAVLISVNQFSPSPTILLAKARLS
jgi:D-alanyl-D-alanine carboxypeptidase